MSDHKPETAELTKKEIAAMREFKRCIADRFCMGRRRIVSMQALHRAGLVEPVYVAGLIADWHITQAGEEWQE